MNHLSGIKETNKKNILKLLYKKTKLSKKRISSELSLSPAVITKLCKELMNEGFIVELDKVNSKSSGPKEILLGINPNCRNFIGITINHINTTIVLSNAAMSMLDKKVIPTHISPKVHLNSLINSLNELTYENNFKKDDIFAIGISIKGTTDGTTSFNGIWSSPVNIKDYIYEHLNIPVVIQNGVCCNALLENLYSQSEDFFFVKYMEPGIGGALVYNDSTHSIEKFKSVDFGHTIVDPTNDYCPICKRKGCLESIISIENLITFIKSNLNNKDFPNIYDLCEQDPNKISIEMIVKEIDSASIMLNNLINNFASIFASSIINIYPMLKVNKIIIIGDLFSSQRFYEYFKSYIFKYQLTPLWDMIEIKPHDNNLLAPIALAIHTYMI